jgi:putative transposase
VLRALGLSPSGYYRHKATVTAVAVTVEESGSAQVKPRPCNVPGRRLNESERQTVRDLLYSTRFIDDTPTEIYATLLDEKIYHCSVRTIYRLLKEDGANQPRGRAKRHTAYSKPELLATRPNQLWSWDITRLKGPRPWTYFYLYVIMDVFSRYVVGFMVAYQESQALARELIDHTLAKHAIVPGQLTLHADRGSAMTSKSVALLLSDLGVAKTHSRPHVSNDNPYSEAQFKTLKYRPEFPDRFGTVCGARAVCAHLFAWYNGEHHHGGIALLTPAMVHYGRAVEVIEARQSRLDAAYKAHPQRFVNHPPLHPELPAAVWINPPVTDADPKGTESTICVT